MSDNLERVKRLIAVYNNVGARSIIAIGFSRQIIDETSILQFPRKSFEARRTYVRPTTTVGLENRAEFSRYYPERSSSYHWLCGNERRFSYPKNVRTTRMLISTIDWTRTVSKTRLRQSRSVQKPRLYDRVTMSRHFADTFTRSVTNRRKRTIVFGTRNKTRENV